MNNFDGFCRKYKSLTLDFPVFLNSYGLYIQLKTNTYVFLVILRDFGPDNFEMDFASRFTPADPGPLGRRMIG